MVYEGTAVSDGAAIGNVFQYRPCGRSVEESFIEAGKVEESIQAYREVLKKAEAELQILAEDKELEEEQRKIFQAHIDIVQDEAMGEEIEEEIRENLFSPEYAVQTVYARYIAVISKAKDALIRERAADLKDVSLRMIRLL